MFGKDWRVKCETGSLGHKVQFGKKATDATAHSNASVFPDPLSRLRLWKHDHFAFSCQRDDGFVGLYARVSPLLGDFHDIMSTSQR